MLGRHEWIDEWIINAIAKVVFYKRQTQCTRIVKQSMI